MATAETARNRRRVVEEAGWRTTSFISSLAGTLTAFGVVVLVAASAGAMGSALGLDTDGISTHEWRQAGIAGTVIGAVVLLGAFWFGGYTAGRMSRRAGVRHGILMVLTTAVIIGAITLVAWALRDTVDIRSTLQDNGVPTGRNTWGDIGVGAAIVGAVAIVVGAITGAINGERWHGRLATAVLEHREAELEAERERTRQQDAMVGDDLVDPTDIDLRNDVTQTAMTVEEERERARTDGAQL